MTDKILCTGSGAPATTQRSAYGEVLAECPVCRRILKPTKAGVFRQHQERNAATRSLDDTRDILWDRAVELAGPKNPHFALGLAVRVRHGAVPSGFDELADNRFTDTDIWAGFHQISDIGSDGSFEVAGWYWRPEDIVVAR